MTDLHSPPEVPTHSSVPVRRSAAPTDSKLRDSCHACATSKVKCYKEKPICSRCAKRGLTCEYVVTKRAGRKNANRSRNNTAIITANLTQALPELSSSTTTSSSGTDYFTSPHLIQPSPRQNTSPDSSDNFVNLFSPVDPFLSSALTNLSTDFDDFLASNITFPISDTSDSDILALLIPNDTFSVFEEAVSENPNTAKPHSPPNSRAFPTSGKQSDQGLHASDSPCCCLIHALGLIKQLSPNASTACTISNGQGHERTTSQTPTIQTVIAENEQTIEAISNMLQCPCSQDGYLLTILSLIVFKVLGWYEVVACEPPTPEDDGQSPVNSHNSRSSSCYSEQVVQSTVMGSYCLNGEDLSRIGAQLVLSELHRVQRLVNQLSQKLKALGSRNKELSTLSSAMDGEISLLDNETASIFSAIMLDQLEADLRKRICTLSLNIINMLRQD